MEQSGRPVLLPTHQDSALRRGRSRSATAPRSNDWKFGPGQAKLEENYALEAPSSQYPTVHFRHLGVANLLYLDGHVEAQRPSRNPLAAWWSPEGVKLVEESHLHDIGTDDSLFSGEGPLGDPMTLQPRVDSSQLHSSAFKQLQHCIIPGDSSVKSIGDELVQALPCGSPRHRPGQRIGRNTHARTRPKPWVPDPR